MRSSLVVRASDCQYTSCNGAGFNHSIRRHSGIWGAADEAVLNIVRKKLKKSPPPPQKKYTVPTVKYRNVCPVVRIGSRPLTRECVSPPLGTKGRQDNTSWRVRGRGEPIRTTREKAWHSVYSVLQNVFSGIYSRMCLAELLQNMFSGIYSGICSAEFTPECVQRNLLQNVFSGIYSAMCSAESNSECVQWNLL